MALVLSLAGSPGVAPSESRGAPLPEDGWPTSTPAAQGLDEAPLTELVRLIRKGERFPDLHGLLVVRNGYLVVEEYLAGYGPEDLHTLQSVSKSFTSALIGIAIDRGAIRSVDERVVEFFPNLDGIGNLDDRKRAMRLEDLLTMRGGTDYHERGADSPHSRLNRMSSGWTRFILGRPMVRQPGTHFQYDSGGVILLSELLRRRTGDHADAFAAKHLFPALGIEKARWFTNREGHPHTGGGLDLRPRDTAKLGLLYLRGGRWGGRQVVSRGWIEASTRRHVDLTGQRDRVAGYGYLWWILPPDPRGAGKQEIGAAMGFRAQYVFVIPEHDMVVVVTGGTRSRADQDEPQEFLYSHILPAVHGPAGGDPE